LDDVTTQASQWCVQARRLWEGPEKSNLQSLPSLFDAIDTGLRLRRQLDALGPDERITSSRRAVVTELLALQRRAVGELGGLAPATPRYQQVASRVKGWLAETRIAVRNVLTGVRLGPLHQALAIEGLRTDIEWFSVLVARLDQETPHPVTTWLDVELDRLRGWLGTAVAARLDVRDEPVRAGCDRLQAVLLERRIERELARPAAGWSADGLWAERFHLSRLQTQVETLDLNHIAANHAGVPNAKISGPDPDPPRFAASPIEWLRLLELRRALLADDAFDRISALDLARRCESCELIVRTAADEVGETIAFLEDMPLRRAVTRLKLMREDLQRLAVSCRRAARKTKNGAEISSGGETPDESGSSDEVVAERSDDQLEQTAVKRLRRQTRRVERLSRRVHSAWQERLLALRMQRLFGRQFVAVLENSVLCLILVLFALIAAQVVLERTSATGLSVRQHEFFAWADLAICSVFLFEFALKLALAPNRLTYFARHFVIDLVASLPFGFIFNQIAIAQLENAAIGAGPPSGPFRPFLRVTRIAIRFLRVALPILRFVRIPLILLRLSDRLVRRMAGLLNRNIVLFEPSQTQKAESSDRHRLVTLRSELEHARNAIEARLDREQRRQLAERILDDLECRIDGLPAEAIDEAAEEAHGREIPVERVVEQLIQMTPERLVDRAGLAFVRSFDRYLRLLDLPLLRRLPMVRNLVAYREKSPAEAGALAANYLGHLIQRGLDVVYFFADLHGTLSPPVFLDRLGATLVNASRTPAKRLLWLGSAFLTLFVVVNALAFLKPLRGIVDKLQNLMGWPVIILGGICLIFWYLGAWFRKIANQSADFCERVVEAQFATHTKNLKSRRRDQDAQFLAARVIDPELMLRASDDRLPPLVHSTNDEDTEQRGHDWFENRELAFLRNVRLLYLDYLDGSPLHRSDTKASVQLLGNLALGNLRRSHLGHLLREGRSIDRLDLSRAGGLLGGPYLWFNYITRMLVQETALLILDYNRHAIPVDRLACSPVAIRRAFQFWLAGRLKIDPDEVWLPEPATGESNGRDGFDPGRPEDCRPFDRATPFERSPRREAGLFLETVEFTAVDFLADEAERDAEIHARFGPQVAELVRRDRQQNVRRAFRSFPLHELPLADRTINPLTMYETYLAGGRVALLPFILARGMAKTMVLAIRGIFRVVHEILHPHVDGQDIVPSDTYWGALRKIHRMRKPVFMGSLWLRARFDVEYLGLPLPTAPAGSTALSLMETDLDYIGATRHDRIIAEQVRSQHQRRLEWVLRWLDRFGWSFDELPAYLAREIPFLANRGGEALRALVAACVLDHNDIATLALSIGGLKRMMAHAADAGLDLSKIPPGLPDPIVNLRRLWHPVNRCKRPVADLFELPCFPVYHAAERRRVLRYLRRHRRVVRGWIKVVLGQGGRDPWATVKSRMRDVLLRTDLWSDQILVLRAVQSLTMLDLQHNCELVWNLGGYTRPEPGDSEPDAQPPRSPLFHEDEPVSARAECRLEPG
jgi:hypothetical protein